MATISTIALIFSSSLLPALNAQTKNKINEIFPENLNSHYIQKGTTLVAAVSMDRIIFAADARVEIIPGDFVSQRYFTDTINKIKTIGNVFYGIAGASHFRDISIDNIINQTYNPNLCLKDNSEIIADTITQIMHEYFSTLTSLEIEYFNEPNRLGIFSIILVGFENSSPSVSMIQITQLKDKNKFSVRKEPNTSHIFTGNESGLLSAGHQTYLKKHLSQGFDASKMTTQDLIHLISLEADQSNLIGKNVNYVTIKPHNIEWGKNY